MAPSIFKRCKTRAQAASEAAGKGITVDTEDTTAHIQAKILMHDLAAEDNQELFEKVVARCAVNYRTVNAELAMHKGIAYENTIRELITEELGKHAVEHKDEVEEGIEDEDEDEDGHQGPLAPE